MTSKASDEFQTNWILIRETKKLKHNFLMCLPLNKSDVFVWCVLYGRSNLFETCQMGKVVQHCENILKPMPDLLRSVASHQTQM